MLYPNLNFFKRFALTFLPRLLFGVKFKIMNRYEKGVNFKKLRYILFSPELETFSYDIVNQDELIRELAEKLSVNVAELTAYAKDFRGMHHLRSTLFKRILNSYRAKIRPKLGRNFVRYLIVRQFKPDLIVETGTKDGLGTFVINSAVYSNRLSPSNNQDGFKFLTMDIVENFGHFIPKDSIVDVYNGDSLSVISGLHSSGYRANKVLLISDSKPGDQIALEFQAVSQICTKELIVMSNAEWGSNFTIESVPAIAQIFNLQERSAHEFYRGNNVEVMICDF